MILVFDLDDTLYDEGVFVDSGFAAVAAHLSPRLSEPAGDLRQRMRSLLAEQGRGRVFDLLLAERGVPESESSGLVRKCIEVYRTHTPDISLSPEVRSLLARLSSTYPLYLVTDGDPDVQARKISALDLDPFFRACYRTWAFGTDAGKPSLFCFDLIREREGAAWRDVMYVGDDPSKDFVNLRRVGARTVRVLTGRCRDDEAAPGHDAEFQIPDVLGIEALIADRRLGTG